MVSIAHSPTGDRNWLFLLTLTEKLQKMPRTLLDVANATRSPNCHLKCLLSLICFPISGDIKQHDYYS